MLDIIFKKLFDSSNLKKKNKFLRFYKFLYVTSLNLNSFSLMSAIQKNFVLFLNIANKVKGWLPNFHQHQSAISHNEKFTKKKLKRKMLPTFYVFCRNWKNISIEMVYTDISLKFLEYKIWDAQVLFNKAIDHQNHICVRSKQYFEGLLWIFFFFIP